MPKMFTIWPFAERVSQPLAYTKVVAVEMVRSEVIWHIFEKEVEKVGRWIRTECKGS